MAENNNEVAKVAINDIGTEEDFIKAVDSTIKNFDDGDLVEGTVVKVDHDEVLLDIGYKTEGVIPSRELSIKKDVDPDEVVEVGDTIEALVVTKEDKEGRLILSKKRAQYERAWGDIEKIKEADGVVEGTVIEAVKGGLIVDIGLRGFLPASLVEMRRVRDLSPYIGQKIKAKVLELDKNRNNVVLSRRQYLEETQSEVRETFLSQLKKGQIREGVVSSIVNFGAFVDLGGVDARLDVLGHVIEHADVDGGRLLDALDVGGGLQKRAMGHLFALLIELLQTLVQVEVALLVFLPTAAPALVVAARGLHSVEHDLPFYRAPRSGAVLCRPPL